ncbi:MAG: DUF4139 domain-containing protein [Myxococcota bacterium]
MITVDGLIDTVTVYRRAAIVVRRARIDVRQGSQEVEMVGLPLSLIDASVRVQAVADDARVDVASVRVGLHVARREDLPEPPDEAELRRLSREIESLELRKEHLEQEQRSLLSLSPLDRPEAPAGTPPGPSPLPARLALDAFVSGQTEEQRQEQLKVQAMLDERERDLADLQQRLALASNAQKVSSQEVTKSAICRLQVDADVSGVQLIVRYQTPGARWFPAYQVRVQGSQAEIGLRALVAQRSGEDWSNVRLEVSTADPVVWTTLPQVSSLRIGRSQHYDEPAPAPRPPPAGADELFADFDAERRRLAPPPRSAYVHQPPSIAPPFEGLEDRRELDMTPESAAPEFDASEDFATADFSDETSFGAARLAMVEPAAKMSAALAPPAPPAAPKGRAMRSKKRKEASSQGRPRGGGGRRPSRQDRGRISSTARRLFDLRFRRKTRFRGCTTSKSGWAGPAKGGGSRASAILT